MDVEAIAGGMDPDAVAIALERDFGGLVYHDEILVGEIGEELADVEVEVALGAALGGVEGDAPGVGGPVFAGFGDGGGPVGGALFGGHVVELLGAVAVEAGQGEPAVGLVGIDVAEEEPGGVGRLFFGFLTKSALAGVEGFGQGDIALAGADVGAGLGQEAESEEEPGAGDAHGRLPDYRIHLIIAGSGFVEIALH